MRRSLFIPLITLTLAGCAAIQVKDTRTTEQLLAAAGFQMKVADTPEKIAHLQTLTPRKVLLRPRHGEPYYVYSDLTVCKCLYAGNEQQYQEFRNLLRQADIADEQLREAEEAQDRLDADLWELWF
jgi:hypothetical protein